MISCFFKKQLHVYTWLLKEKIESAVNTDIAYFPSFEILPFKKDKLHTNVRRLAMSCATLFTKIELISCHTGLEKVSLSKILLYATLRL